MEQWRSGALEYWSVGSRRSARNSITPSLHYSITPSLHYPNSHSVFCRSVYDLVKGVFNDSFRACGLEPRDEFTDDVLVDNRLDGHPAGLAEARNRRAPQRRQALQQGREVSLLQVHLEADLRLGFQGALEHQGHRLDFAPLPRIFPGTVIGDKPRRGNHQFIDDPKLVGPKGRAGLGDLDDGIDQLVRFDLGRAPRKFDRRFHAVLAKVFLRQVHHFGGDAFALEVLHRFDGGILRHRQHPAGGLARRLAEQKFAHLMDARSVLVDPVESRDAAIQITQLDVAADLLRPNHPDFQLRVVHIGDIGTAADGNVPTGLGHFFDGGLLQTALGQPELQLLLLFVAHPASCKNSAPTRPGRPVRIPSRAQPG